MIGLDTNVVIRYLTQDDRTQSAIANRLIEQTLDETNPGFISVLALAEIVWVLESGYRVDRAGITAIVDRFLRSASIVVGNAEAAARALRDYKIGGADFADCLIARLGGEYGCERTVTFDKLAARDAGMELLSTPRKSRGDMH